MTYYLGKVGTLVALPDPEVGLSITPERIGATHQLLSGARVRDTLGTTWPQSWQMQWTALDLGSYGTLAQFTALPGPFYLIDPELRNLLAPNVSMGTSITGDTTGFTVAAGTMSIFGATGGNNLAGVGGPFPLLSSGTLGVLVRAAAVSGTQIFTTASVPVVAGTSYTGSVYISNHTTTAGMSSRINWLDSGGTWVATSPSATTVAPGATGRSVSTDTAPANAWYARLDAIITTSNTSGSDQSADFDGLQLEKAAAVSPWVPGFGVPLVTVESLSRAVPLSGVTDAQMTLVQVG